MNSFIKLLLFTIVFLSGASNALTFDNIKQPAKPTQESNFLVGLLQLNNLIMGQAKDSDKSTHSSSNIETASEYGHLMLADAGNTHVITKEKNKVITSEKDSKTPLIRVTKKNDTRSPVTTITYEEFTENDNKPEAKEEIKTVFKEMVVTEEIEKDSHYTSPSTRITRAQIETQNAQTTEEVLKFQPSLQIRQRYVGDPNGVLGIRGC